MKVKNLEIGLRVQVKSEDTAGFYVSSAGKFGTIIELDVGEFLDVRVQYEDGAVEWGNHKGIKRVNVVD